MIAITTVAATTPKPNFQITFDLIVFFFLPGSRLLRSLPGNHKRVGVLEECGETRQRLGTALGRLSAIVQTPGRARRSATGTSWTLHDIGRAGGSGNATWTL